MGRRCMLQDRYFLEMGSGKLRGTRIPEIYHHHGLVLQCVKQDVRLVSCTPLLPARPGTYVARETDRTSESVRPLPVRHMFLSPSYILLVYIIRQTEQIL